MKRNLLQMAHCGVAVFVLLVMVFPGVAQSVGGGASVKPETVGFSVRSGWSGCTR